MIINSGRATMRRMALVLAATFALAAFGATGTAQAAPRCVNTHDFSKWLADFKKDALAHGITRQTLNAAGPGTDFR